MMADLPVFHANNGILDRALEIVLVRRDMPGIAFLPKTDPDILLSPEPALDRTVTGGTLQQVSEERRIGLLDFGARHDGAASYFVFATFARWVSPVHPMEVRHPVHSVGPGDARPVREQPPPPRCSKPCHRCRPSVACGRARASRTPDTSKASCAPRSGCR